MNRYWLLVKTQVINQFQNTRNRNGRQSKISSQLIMILTLLGLSLYLMFVSTASTNTGKLVYIFSMTFLLILIGGISMAQGTLYSNKDTDILRAMPFTDREIVASRITVYLEWEYIYAIGLTLPATVYLGIQMQMGVLYYIYYLLALAVLPLLPSVIAALMASFLTHITSGRKHADAIKNGTMIGIAIAVIAAIILPDILYDNATFNITDYLPSSWAVNSMLSGDITPLLGCLGLSLGALLLFVGIFSRSVLKISSDSTKGYHVKNFKVRNLKQRSIFSALVNREFRRYMTNFLYMMNTSFGLWMMIAAAVFLAFYGRDMIAIMDPTGSIDWSGINIFIYLILGALIGTNAATGSSISLEGKTLWIIKTMPIKTSQILTSKILVGILISLIPSLLTIGILCIGLPVTAAVFAEGFVYILLSCIFTSCIGIILNLIFPKLDFEHEAEVIKQSMSAFLSMMIPMGLAIVVSVIFYRSGFNTMLFIAIIGLYLVLDIVSVLIIKLWGEKKFAEL